NHAATIRGISMFKLTDWNQAEVDTLAVYYGFPNDTAFKEYLRTLGIRTWSGDGTNKIAYETIRCNVNARNFCSTGCLLTIPCNCSNIFESVIYPNPASGQMSIVWKQRTQATIELYALDGRLVFSQQAISPATIAVDELASGIYTCVIRQEDGSEEKFRVVITNN
ncbi:MAG: T9SS type A sorting domain-containing protein, partial [Bacteroidia bacterium]